LAARRATWRSACFSPGSGLDASDAKALGNIASRTRETTMSRKLLTAAVAAQAAVFAPAFAQAPAPFQDAARPIIKPGDAWTYRNTTETTASGWKQVTEDFSVTRVTSSSIYYAIKTSGSSQPPRETFSDLQWSRLRAVDGKETVVNHSLDFPLAAGKTWTVHYHESHPNKSHKYEEWTSKYTVMGIEAVEVPAGKFDAIKIEAEGNVTAELEPAVNIAQGSQTSDGSAVLTTQVDKTESRPIENRTYKAIWYVPAIKRWVKTVEEYYGGNGVRNERYTSELVAFKPAE